MSHYALAPPAQPSVAIHGEAARYAVRRIYCVGRNYAEHTREMGGDPKSQPPIFFTKPADALVEDGATIPYAQRTGDLHHEVELVVALGSGGRAIAEADALGHVFGYAVGNDYTRRDLQLAAKKRGEPWDVGKAFDLSAGIGAIHPATRVGHPTRGRIWLTVNAQPRQASDLASLIWSVPAIIAALSMYFELRAGDLIYTGTPEGVGPLVPGDVVIAGIDGLGTLTHTIGPAA